MIVAFFSSFKGMTEHQKNKLRYYLETLQGPGSARSFWHMDHVSDIPAHHIALECGYKIAIFPTLGHKHNCLGRIHIERPAQMQRFIMAEKSHHLIVCPNKSIEGQHTENFWKAVRHARRNGMSKVHVIWDVQ